MESIKSLSELSIGQFALLQTDPNTGTPVNLHGEWASKGNERYLLFDSESAARYYASSELQKNSLLEWGLYDANGEQIDILHDRKALIKAAQPKPKNFWKKWFG